MASLEGLFAALVRWRLVVALGLLASVAVALGFARGIERDFTIEHYFPRAHPERTAYERWKERFPIDEGRALVMVESADVFADDALLAIERLADDLAALPEVASVRDPLRVRRIEGEGEDAIGLRALIGSVAHSPADPVRVAVARRAVREEPLYRSRIAAPDATAAAIEVRLTRVASQSAEGRERYLAGAERVLAAHSHAERRLTLTGTPSVRAQFVRGIRLDLGRLFPLAVVLAGALLLVAFRSAFDAAAGLLGPLVGIAWTFGLIGLLGIPLTFLTAATPVALLAVGLSDGIHLITEMRARTALGEPPREAVARAHALLAGPCLVTALTVATGLAALLAMDVGLVDDFALAAGAGMLLTWLATLLVLPVAYGLRAPRPLARDAGAPLAIALADRALGALARFPIARPRAAALVALGLFGGLGALGWQVGRECYLLDDLPASSPILADRRRVEAKLGGTFSLVVHARAEPGAILEPDALRALAACEEALRAEDAVEGTTSILDWLREAHRRLAPAEAALDPLPATRGLAAQELLLCEDRRETPSFIDLEYGSAAIHARIRDLGSTRMRGVIERVRGRLERVRASAPPGLAIELTGLPVVMQGVFDEVVPDLVTSFGLSLLAGLAVFALLFRSLRYGLVAVVPNALPSLATFAFMTVAGIDLKPTTVIVFSVAFAIAADDTIHYLARFRRYVEEGEPLFGLAPGRPEEAAALALRESGLAIALTSTALALGFSVLALSLFLPVVYVGVLTGFTLLAAAAAEMLVTPLLAIRFLRPRGRP